MNKAYNRINNGKGWKNYPSDETPLNEQNLNKQDIALDEIDNRVIILDNTKATKVEVSPLFKEVEYDEQTGIITFTRKNGATVTIDTPMEKIALNIYYDPVTEMLTLPLIDGTQMQVDLSRLITEYEFVDSDTIAFSIKPDGKVTAIVKEGSIEEKHLRPDYLADIKVEAAKAEASATAAAQSESSAAASAETATQKSSEAAISATAAASSAASAEKSASTATIKAEAATASAESSAKSAETAEASATAAAQSESSAAASAETATQKSSEAAISATAAGNKAEEASGHADLSRSYAVGTGGEVRENDDTDCSEYYYEQVKRISQSISGVVPMGSVSFDALSDPNNQKPGYLFNINESFMSDEGFLDGGGIFYGAGSNVLRTADGKWDVLAAAMVNGVKGAAETEYRQGFVNITKSNIGLGNVGDFKAVSTASNQGLSSTEKNNARNNISALAVNGNTKDNTVSFINGDNTSPTAWTDIPFTGTGEKHSVLWNRATTFFKNVRYIWKLIGNTPISEIADSTITGAIKNFDKKNVQVITYGGILYEYEFTADKDCEVIFSFKVPKKYSSAAVEINEVTVIALAFAWGDGNPEEFLMPASLSVRKGERLSFRNVIAEDIAKTGIYLLVIRS